MNEHIHNSPELGYQIDTDGKYVSGLSTVLVATIEEAKERINQIEFVFCNQLFPKFQSKTKSLQQIYSEARKSVEDEWEKKENGFIVEQQKVQLENQQLFEQNQSLMLENAQMLKEHEEKMNPMRAKINSQQLKIDKLEKYLMQKSKEVDEGMELHCKLLQLVQTNGFTVRNRGKHVSDHEEKANTLDSLKEKFDELQEEVRRKDEELENGKEFSGNLFKKIECQAAEIINYERQLADHQKERNLLVAKVGKLEERVGELQKELTRIGNESAEVKGLYDNLLKVNLLKVIDLKKTELQTEKKQRRDVIDNYKHLKSQYDFLLKKNGLTNENMVSQKILEDKTGDGDSLRYNQNPSEHGNKSSGRPTVASETNEMNEICYERVFAAEKGSKSVQPSSSRTPNLGFRSPKKSPTSAKSAGLKRPASSNWRETRSRQGQGGPDPHNDFLDTPLEKLKEKNFGKTTNEENNDIPIPEPDNAILDSSDDETQDPNANPKRQVNNNIQVIGKTGFKYNEPVRKKAERENLRGIECKQCKKFYDAVLPNNGGKDADGNKQNLRCEHHNGVSRHRFRYAPPLTPEGFWNIGFESEMSERQSE